MYTGMAIDAFRKEIAAERRLEKAKNESRQAARRMPREELPIWAIATEIIRVEEDQKEAKKNHDTETDDWCAEHLVGMRRQLKELESK